MTFEQYPTLPLNAKTFHLPVAPAQILADSLNRHLDMNRHCILCFRRNFSHIMNRLNRGFTALEERRAFAAFQLMCILEEIHHAFLILERDSLLCEDATELVEHVVQAMRNAASHATVLLYALAIDHFLEKMIRKADRFYFEEMPRSLTKPFQKIYRRCYQRQSWRPSDGQKL